MRKMYILLSLLLVFSYGCSENIFEGAADKNTADAEQDAIDFLFIKGDQASNCAVKNKIAVMKSQRELTPYQKYLYNSASLGCTGFSLKNSLSDLLDKGDGSELDPYSMVQSLMGVSVLNAETISKLRDDYKEILDNCKGIPTSEKNMTTVCGMTAVSDTVLTLSTIALVASGKDSIDLTPSGVENMGTYLEDTFKNSSDAEIKAAVEIALPSQATIDRLAENVTLVTNTTEVITDIVGADDSLKLKEDIDAVVNGLEDSNGNITVDSLTSYINSQFVNK